MKPGWPDYLVKVEECDGEWDLSINGTIIAKGDEHLANARAEFLRSILRMVARMAKQGTPVGEEAREASLSLPL